ncbi:hypothetical protein BIW11_08337 [Tropilaelaps mercedesae]|uniref:Uncharacterized protein n=1 Tax=Tropilaelaps mercedesae TaxID=418985 RepID=A0A1V9XPZ1_9ACAR|nr:hypothetical protein BIW11_08337 [Tropilaelaps mercedesae]
MSTSTTVTLTLKSKPKIQPIQSAPKSPSTAVKLRLTKTNGQASSPGTSPVQTSAPTSGSTVVPSSTEASSTSERKSPPKNGTGAAPKLVRKLSVTSPGQSIAKDIRDEPIVYPPRAKVLSRFPLKRNSFDRSAFGVELKRVDRSASVSKDTKKEEAKTNGNVSTIPPEQLPTKPEEAAVKTEENAVVSSVVVNGVATQPDSTEADIQINGNPVPIGEPTASNVVENGQAEAISEKDKENITVKIKDTGEESKKELVRKTVLRKSVKKKSSTAVECRTTAVDENVTAQAIANGNPEPKATVSVVCSASQIETTSTQIDEITSAALSEKQTMATTTTMTDKSKVAAEVSEDVGANPIPLSESADMALSCSSATSEERLEDEIEEVSSSSTLTPAPSEERELALPTITTTATTTAATTTTTTTSETEASAVVTTTTSSPAARPRIANTLNVHIINSTSDSCSSTSIVNESDAATREAGLAAEAGPIGGTQMPSEAESSRAEDLVQTPRLATHPNTNVATPKAAKGDVTASAIERLSATGASPKDVVAAKPPKPDTASEAEKDTVMKSVKNATASAIGKTLQKPLNLAQKVLEAALHVKSPSNNSASQAASTCNAQPMPSTSFSTPQTGAVAPVISAGSSLVERVPTFAPGYQSQPPSRPSSVMANIQTVDIRNLDLQFDDDSVP